MPKRPPAPTGLKLRGPDPTPDGLPNPWGYALPDDWAEWGDEEKAFYLETPLGSLRPGETLALIGGFSHPEDLESRPVKRRPPRRR